MESDAMQSIPEQMAASPEALALATEILTGNGTMTTAIEQVGGLLAGLVGVDLVATTLVLLRPEDTAQWMPLGERAWLREWRRPGTRCSVAPRKGSGPDQALTMPWLSPRARASVIAVVDVEALPAEAEQDRHELTGCGVRAVVSQSIAHHGTLYGSVAMAREEPGPWPDSHLSDVRLLSAAVASRMAEELAQLALHDALRRGDDAHRSKEHFFAALGHELRTPIAAIIGTAEMLGEDAQDRVELDGSEFATAVARDAGVVLRAAEQLHAVVEELLGTSKELGGGTETQWVDVAEAVADVEHWLAAPARAGGVAVHSEVPPEVLVRTTPSALRQILTNLVGNAIAYHRPGGSVHVTATRAHDEFGRARVRIGVRDDGPGLTPEQQRQVFEPFVRFAGPEVQGTGLGLSLSRTLAERDGGLMGVESTPGEGSVFWLDLAST